MNPALQAQMTLIQALNQAPDWWPMAATGSPGACGLPAFRGLLLPAAAVVHRPRCRPRFEATPGRTQDGPRAAARAGHQRALAGAPLRLQRRYSVFWTAKGPGGELPGSPLHQRLPFSAVTTCSKDSPHAPCPRSARSGAAQRLRTIPNRRPPQRL